ncbi:MAG: phosphoribosylglycinamide formyltransferase [Immundisolibacteraceae bacterium]|nr:phosphoribosylglycinamide formyltransferase [Immundisolibacteraceae bacterium]
MNQQDLKRLVLLISGRGSNLIAIADAIDRKELSAEIVLVVSNRVDATGLELARARGLPVAVIESAGYADREQFDQALADRLASFEADWIVLAGFMRILSDRFINRFAGQIVNVHPSLLPAFPGLHTHQRVLEAGLAEHGASIHLVTAELDGGPLLGQVTMPVHAGDNVSSLARRVLEQEHRLYPEVLKLLVDGRLGLDNSGRLLLDGEPSAGVRMVG